DDQLVRYLVRAKGLTSEELLDVASETWGRAVRLIARYEDRGHSFFAWLKAIANNVAREHFKKHYLKDASGAWRRAEVSLDARVEAGAEPAAGDDPADHVLRM